MAAQKLGRVIQMFLILVSASLFSRLFALTPGRGAERLAMRVVSAFLAYASARASMDTSSMEAIV